MSIDDTEKQDKFCDNNCVWTNHHPGCIRAAPPECKTEAEKRAYAFGWWKALEHVRQNGVI